jgi:Tol biopolymer transport system component
VTQEHNGVWGIAWSPDGRSIVYGGGTFATPHLWRISSAGGTPERLEAASDRAEFPTVSAASRQLAYVRYNEDHDIWKLEGTGSLQPFLSSTFDERNAQFSPDGKRIVFESNRLGKDSQIWVANADGTNATPLNEGLQGTWGSPRWLADSLAIVMDGPGQNGGPRTIYVMDAAGGQPRPIVGRGAVPGWSHDSKSVYFNAGGQIWRAPASGGTATQVTDNGGVSAIESPDGKTLYYLKTGGSVFARPVAGGPERAVVHAVSFYGYFPVVDGLYYIPPRDPKAPFSWEVRFLDTRTGKDEALYRFQARLAFSLSVSPDRATILVSGRAMSAGNDLMLVRNFH